MSAPVKFVPGNLRPPLAGRWTARFKAMIVEAVLKEMFTPEEACDYWGLSREELEGWMRKYAAFGVAGLRATRAQKYRDSDSVT